MKIRFWGRSVAQSTCFTPIRHQVCSLSLFRCGSGDSELLGPCTEVLPSSGIQLPRQVCRELSGAPMPFQNHKINSFSEIQMFCICIFFSFNYFYLNAMAYKIAHNTVVFSTDTVVNDCQS